MDGPPRAWGKLRQHGPAAPREGLTPNPWGVMPLGGEVRPAPERQPPTSVGSTSAHLRHHQRPGQTPTGGEGAAFSGRSPMRGTDPHAGGEGPCWPAGSLTQGAVFIHFTGSGVVVVPGCGFHSGTELPGWQLSTARAEWGRVFSTVPTSQDAAVPGRLGNMARLWRPARPGYLPVCSAVVHGICPTGGGPSLGVRLRAREANTGSRFGSSGKRPAEMSDRMRQDGIQHPLAWGS